MEHASFLSVGSGIQMGWPSPSVPKLISGDLGYNISPIEASYVVMLAPLGYVIGCPISGIMLDKIGRKHTLLTLAPIQIISWIMVTFSKDITTLYIARVMMGMTDGGLFTSLPAYIGEIMEPKVRGMASTSQTLGLLLGSLLINTYGSYVSIKTAACISSAAPVIFFITFMWMPESPYYYIAKGADDKARSALKSLRRMECVEEELDGIRTAVNRQMEEPGTFKEIFMDKSNLKAFSILIVLRTLQQLAGLYAISFYMQTIFEMINTVISPDISCIICNSTRIPLTFLSSLMIDYFGRRILFSSSGLCSGFCLGGIATYCYLERLGYDLQFINWFPFAAMMLFYVSSSIGLLTIPNLMMGELLASNIKSKALAIINMWFGLCTSGTSKLFQWTSSSFGIHVSFYMFTIFCFLGVIFVYKCVPETKGKSLEEIQQILKGDNQN